MPSSVKLFKYLVFSQNGLEFLASLEPFVQTNKPKKHCVANPITAHPGEGVPTLTFLYIALFCPSNMKSQDLFSVKKINPYFKTFLVLFTCGSLFAPLSGVAGVGAVGRCM